MPSKFRIYSTDVEPTLTPDTSWILPYDDTGSDNVLFVVGETVTGAGGGAGVVQSVTGTASSGTLVINRTNSINFVDDEVLTGSIAGIADVNSATGGEAPSTLIEFDQDPLFGNYDPNGSSADRGTVIKTFGGNIIQDFGVVESDGIITFSDTDALESDTIADLKTAYETIDGQFYFTDGYECWKVQFSRDPKGFKSYRNILAAYHGEHWFSYEIQLLVVSKEI